MDRELSIARNPDPFIYGRWQNETVSWRNFAAGLSEPYVGSELFADYLKMNKKEKRDCKGSGGGYFGGFLSDGIRRKHHVTKRDILNLDFDHLPSGDDKVILSMCNMLGCDFVIHSSQSHTTAAPRLRVIIPLSRSITSEDEYAAVSRKMASKIDPSMSKLDKTTHEYERLMLFPRHSKDAPYIYIWAGQSRPDLPLCDVDAVLSEYADWRNADEWPKAPENDFPRPQPSERKLKTDPAQRAEPIGSFCEYFTVEDAIDAFLPDVYERVDDDASGHARYTYRSGTTAAGAIVYDSKFLFSHHDTDPASGKTLNAFELLQLHKFGDLDEKANANKDIDQWNDKESFKAMCEWLQADDAPELQAYRIEVVKNRNTRYSDFISSIEPTSAEEDFGAIAAAEGAEEIAWDENARNKDGSIKATITNALRILLDDPRLKGRIKFDVIRNQLVVKGDMPWQFGDMLEGSLHREDKCLDENGWRTWTEGDEAGLRSYIEDVYGIGGAKRAVVMDALKMLSAARLRNGVREYLEGLTWDGKPRVETVFIDYLGAEDDPTTREMTRKALLGCVYRAFEPGHKFDEMVVLIGPQGVGKSTILRKLAHDAWFNDSLHNFDGQKVAENIKGAWIVEIGELHALRKAEVGQIRQILASQVDRFRLPYHPDATANPRHCIFFGTGNDPEVVRDPEGERRFWIIETSVNEPDKSVWDDLTKEEIDQIWAEAVVYYRAGESSSISAESKVRLLDRQKDFRDADPWETSVEEFLRLKVPKDWRKWPMNKRREFWAARLEADVVDPGETDDWSNVSGLDGQPVGELVPRDRVTCREVWSERLSGNNTYQRDWTGDKLDRMDRKRIGTILRALLVGGRFDGTKWKYQAVRSTPESAVEKGYQKVSWR